MVLVWLAAVPLAVLALYVLFTAVLYLRLFVAPSRQNGDDFQFTPWEFQADYEDVDLVAADGVAFGAWFFRNPGTSQVVIVSGGHKGQRSSVLGICVALWRKGFNVITYSYRGYAGADRAPITMGVREVLELQAVIAFARKRVRDARIGLLGYSMGGAVSLLGAAGEPGVEALVLDSAFSNAPLLIRENVRRATRLPGGPFVWLAALWLRWRTGARLAEASPIAVLPSLEPRPLFFIHGGADEITGVHHSRRLYDAYRGPREIWIVQGSPHAGAYFADRELYVERVAGFFARHLGMAPPSHNLRLVEEDEEAG
jgi:uncharacterized protein